MIESLLTLDNPYNSINEIYDWIKKRNNEVLVNIQRISFGEMKNWYSDFDGSLKHESGRFFSINGIHVETDYGAKREWDQPVINQPEIGYLGIITKEINGVLYFLMQAKIEPGNVNYVQISPTLQATKSNYSTIHKGKRPHYLEYFVNAKPNQILLDQLQSEQGSRFLRKRNRNIIIKVDDEIELLDDYKWMTLGQIKDIMYNDNLVNMDTRTVISGIDFVKYLTPLVNKDKFSSFGKAIINSALQPSGLHTMSELLSWLTNLKAQYDLFVSPKPINKLNDWRIKDDEISRIDGKYFRIIGVNVSISNREVTSWCQPLVEPMQQGLCAFIIRQIGNVYHFLVQAKLECGNFDVIELAPTVQCLTGNVFESAIKPPFVEYVLNIDKSKIIYDTFQSEEGGRFYKEQNRNMIIIADNIFPVEVPANYSWMTLNQMHEFLRFNNFLNIQARSLLAAIKYI